MLKLFARFAKNHDGLAALEFALIAPLMIVLFYGAVELSTAIDCKSRVNRVGFTVADLVAQSSAVSSADTTNVFNCANAILYPYASGNAKIIVSSLVDNGKGGATVAWSDAQNTSARSKGTTMTVPAGLITSGSGGSVIYGEISYSFTAPITYFLGGPITLTSSFYAKPRRSTTVTHT
ncbi:Flp pilus assembly protein TadG [Rhizomicrobium palustre]|jgi:Flp pilus assembly protein TadG|uniref:Flp pilus assembly protein TadG n=1 Tax=Rhizomicrobium palustre TaxID=189966 RepID=A0A846MWJ2_9PROT|nr:TadE/TadG family type IV pilus assembly protein [Rhizomicrobium palustre]NIK87894.1 Flp pilus assembly protein TadG [Rhizomicrobium palustre]